MCRPISVDGVAQGYGSPQNERIENPQTVEALESGVLAARREVVLANRRARKAAKPAYVNTDASWRDGLAGLAYVGALGTRTEVVACADNHAGEYLALLMAMGDAERCLGGKVAFRMDSQTVVNLQAGSKGQFEHLCARVKLLLARHPDWTLVLVAGNRNKVADNLSRRAFRRTDESRASGRAWSSRQRRRPSMSESSSGSSSDPELDIRPSAEPRYSRSLEFALAIISCFTAEKQILGIAELADRVAVSRSTTHRYAQTLVELGCLEQDRKRRYRLAQGITSAGKTFLDTVRLETPAARKVLEDLREQTGHTVSMGVLDRHASLHPPSVRARDGPIRG